MAETPEMRRKRGALYAMLRKQRRASFALRAAGEGDTRP